MGRVFIFVCSAFTINQHHLLTLLQSFLSSTQDSPFARYDQALFRPAMTRHVLGIERFIVPARTVDHVTFLLLSDVLASLA